jgi:hypothetical protein
MSLWSWVKSRPSVAGRYGKKVVAADQIKAGAVLIQDLAKSMAPPSEDSVRRETFANACQRLNLNEASLRQTYKFFTTRFLIFLFFGVLSFVFMLGSLFSSVWAALPLIGFTALCGAQMYVSSFRCAQIRHHELFPVRVWVKNPQEWWIHTLPGEETPPPKKSSSSSLARRDAQGNPIRPSNRRP